jgi:hypothetical protein
MASDSEEELQNTIDILQQVVRGFEPESQEYMHWHAQLVERQQRLADAQRAEASGTGSSYSAEPAGPSRKRNLGLSADDEWDPQPKRVSPSTHGNSVFHAPIIQQWSNIAGEAPGGNGVSDYIDLTVSDPSSPDPFPELTYAFRDDGARPVPADAFNQEFMRPDELAQFLLTPTPANGGYALQPEHQAATASFQNRHIPYLPGPQLPDWMGRDSDDENYGDFPLNATEAESIDKMLEIVQQNGDDTQDDREQTPRIMSSTLKEYQKIGLTWLIKMEAGPNKGGILADEMGLGKTVQALALICARPSQEPLCKTTLIVAPVALMRQWEKEISRHVHDRHKLGVYLYWGNGKKADFSLLRQYDVVLTTFGTLTSEFKQKDSRRESMLYEREQKEPNFRRKPRDKLALLGHECMWYRIIIDEAHMIKNRNSIQSKASVDLQARHRLCLTGTP